MPVPLWDNTGSMTVANQGSGVLDATYTYAPSGESEVFATGDVLIFAIATLAQNGVDPGPPSTPLGWSLVGSQSDFDGTDYWREDIYTYVWGLSDDKSTFTAQFRRLAAVGLSAGGPNLMIHAQDAAGAAVLESMTDNLLTATPASLGYVGSAVLFEIDFGHSQNIALLQAWLTVGTDTPLYFAFTFPAPDLIGGTWDFSPTPDSPFGSTHSLSGDFEAYAAAYGVPVVPPADPIRFRGHIRVSRG